MHHQNWQQYDGHGQRQQQKQRSRGQQRDPAGLEPFGGPGGSVPADSTIKAAYLYWVASQDDGTEANADNQVTLTVGGVASTVTASRVWTGTNSNGGSMGAFANVTSLMPTVTAANSTVRMDGLSIQINGSQCGTPQCMEPGRYTWSTSIPA